MEKYFATYNQSLALKELGFDEDCCGVFYLIPETKKWEPYRIMEESNHNKSNFSISRPLIGQVFEWFREKHNIHGIVSYYGKGQWNIEILDYKGNELIQIEDNTFWSYEEAESACIDKLIELLQHDK